MIEIFHDHPVSLSAGEVHLWILTNTLPWVEKYFDNGYVLLSTKEKKRIANLKDPTVARRFALGRILTRRVLAQYLNEDPAAIAMHYNANGKPEFDSPPANVLSFNLSHSKSEMVLAITRAPGIGIDIESMDRKDAAHRIALRHFSACEIRDLIALGSQAPKRALILWTMKESIVKASGDTVWDGLDKLSLEIDTRHLAWCSPQIGKCTYYQLAVGNIGMEYVASCAVISSRNQTNEPFIFRTYRLGNVSPPNFGFNPRIDAIKNQISEA